MGVYEELKERGLVAQVTNEEEIRKLVNEGKAVFYIGFDPTADSLHVGHFMALCLMKRLQEAGNRPIALVGGGTGMIGDPSGRTDLRKVLTIEDIDHNCECFKKQMSRFIDFGEGKAIMVNNADWLRNLNYVEFLRDIGPHFSVNRMLTAECYKLRMEQGLTFLEFNYMIMQAFDFYSLYQKYGCNMQFGGDDQWSNMLAGTELIRRKLGKDAHALTINLLTKSDGTKMGKTSGGAVWLDKEKTKPYDFYQYWRNVDDSDVIKCIKMLTFLPLDQIKEMESWTGSKLNEAKSILAYELTKLVHGEDEANKCDATAKAIFSGDMSAKNMPKLLLKEEDTNDGTIDIVKALVLSKLCTSNGDARRNIEQGGVFVDEAKVTDIKMTLDKAKLKDGGVVVRKGKKNFIKVLLSVILLLVLSIDMCFATSSEIESTKVITPMDNGPDIIASVVDSDFVVSSAVIDPETKGNIETYIVKDNSKITFYIANANIDPHTTSLQNYYYRTINNKNVKIRCRDFLYNSNENLNIVPSSAFANLKASNVIDGCLFIYQIDYKTMSENGLEDKSKKFAFKIVSEKEYDMYHDIENKKHEDKNGEIKRPRKVDN